MKKVIVYKTPHCPYCVRATELLTSKNIPFETVDVSVSADLMKKMIEKSQRKTVPQIFIGDYHVGGYTDLAELSNQGKLESLLNEEN